MAGRFSESEWAKINGLLAEKPQKYNLPEGGREDSVVLSSFNIRKLNKPRGRERELDFIAQFCARCDLVAIQEIQDSLDGLIYLRDRVNERVSSDGEYGLIVSDITGEVPGESGMAERLGFLYRNRRIRRSELVSDITIDRTGVLTNFEKNEQAFAAAWREFNEKLKAYETGKRKTKPTFALPSFLTFTRTPHVAGFEVPGKQNAAPIGFLAVNAHLLYGTPKERAAEFQSLVRWLAFRLKEEDYMAAPNFILLGDLNLNLDKPEADKAAIDNFIRGMNAEAFGSPDKNRIYFPFIDKHPVAKKMLRSNARLDQTYDQIAFFAGAREKALPNHKSAANIKDDPNTFDFGVFNFAELFANATAGKTFHQIKSDKNAFRTFSRKFEYSVSDHMPIWVRIRRPGF